MLLTSLNRIKAGRGVSKAAEDVLLGQLIHVASQNVETHLRREGSIQLTSRVKYFSPSLGQRSFALPAYPVSSITSVYTDSTGLYTGDETLLASTQYLVSEDGRTLILTADPAINYNMPGVYTKSLKVTYTGGLASTPVISSWTKSASSFTVGKYIQGGTSGAIGKITATASGTISYESYSGVFEASETITEYTTYTIDLSDGGLSAATGVTATLTAVTTQCLAEAYPDLSTTTEFYVDYLFRNRHDSDSVQIIGDGGAQRSSNADLKNDFFATPMIRSLLRRFENKLVEG